MLYKDSLLSLESPLGSDYWYAVYLVVQRILEKLGYSGDTAADLFTKSLDLSKSKEDIMNVTQAIKQEGIEQGIQQGIRQGMQEGEQNKALGIARTMLTKGYDPHEVKTLTGISQEAISEIKPTKKQS